MTQIVEIETPAEGKDGRDRRLSRLPMPERPFGDALLMWRASAGDLRWVPASVLGSTVEREPAP